MDVAGGRAVRRRGRAREAGRREVGIADGLDLLDAERRACRIEPGEHLVQRRHDRRDRESCGDVGEADEVESDGDVVEAIGDQALAAVEPIDDRLRQDVQQEFTRPTTLDVQLGHDPVEEAGVARPRKLDLAERGLELPNPTGQADRLLPERRDGLLGPRVRGPKSPHVPAEG